MNEIPSPDIPNEAMRHLMLVLSVGDESLQLLKLQQFTEYFLNQAIMAYLRTDAAGLKRLRLGYAQKVAFLEVSHLLPNDGAQLLQRLNALRQKIAHELEYSLSESDKQALMTGLGDKLPDVEMGNIFMRLAAFLGGYLSGSLKRAKLAAEQLGKRPNGDS
jgi:hypothetical protein